MAYIGEHAVKGYESLHASGARVGAGTAGGLTNKRKRLLIAFVAIAILLSCYLLTSAFAPNAFAEFTGSAAKVLGVGRIQSATTAVESPQSQQRFAVSTSLATADGAKVSQLATPVTQSADSASNGGTQQPVVGWSTVLASRYTVASSSDTTATGDAMTDSSMGVAVPVEWSYLVGKTIEIRYNGQVVRAVINDTGGFLSLGRALDLQPGVCAAFGVGTGDDWGVRTVEWRIVS